MNATSRATESAKIKPLPYLALATGILALSFSAMFVRWANAPGPITGLYRVFLSSLLLTPFFVQNCRKDCKINKSNIVFPVLGGLFTAGDFALWNTSIHYTTAANATLLGNTAPLWVAIGAWLLFRERLSTRFWLGLGLALAGAALILGTDFLLHPRLGIGDLMAIGTGVFYAGYMLVTQRSRQHFNPLTHLWLMGSQRQLWPAGNQFSTRQPNYWVFNTNLVGVLRRSDSFTNCRLYVPHLCARTFASFHRFSNDDRPTNRDSHSCRSAAWRNTNVPTICRRSDCTGRDLYRQPGA